MRSAWQPVTHSTTKIKPAIFAAALATAILLPALPNPSIAHADTDCSANGIETGGAGSAWLSGGGVNICNYPGAGANVCVLVAGAPADSHCNNTAGLVWSGTEWQCVEMINRLYLTKGWTTATWYVNDHITDVCMKG